MSRDPNEHHQIVLVDGSSEDKLFNPINQISLFVSDLHALKLFYAGIQNKEIIDLQVITHGNVWSVYFRDP